MVQLVKDLDLKAFHNGVRFTRISRWMVQLVKDLDLKAFHNAPGTGKTTIMMVQLVKDLDLKAFHNHRAEAGDQLGDGTARQRS